MRRTGTVPDPQALTESVIHLIGDNDSITQLLDQFADGDEASAARLLELIYDELRQLAAAQMRRERPEHTLQPTALVHEAWIRLIGANDQRWQNRAHFFGAAAEVMRRILVDCARARLADKRGGNRRRMPLDDHVDWSAFDAGEIVAVHDALERLAAIDSAKAQVVLLRVFGGLNIEEIAAALGISDRTVKRHWRFAKAWLKREIGDESH